MHHRTVTAQTGFADLPSARRPPCESPIYDAIERQWLQEGREVPRQQNRARTDRYRTGDGDLFRRA
ncbi:hypothetical protein AMK16_20175 [Streptomyces sp. CB00455]|uniref:hypothetical protein n=1 Tax=Streptomyces sp. CB00455 TaxID=1703927 RepID=UPI000939E64E|nr:hypothetical protein [Streptomyces sp. CB00455]OKK17215.1 hypothetical protein AMK16_20175 [Streptomyces sp. CB00455]